jgi:hypothetical protein
MRIVVVPHERIRPMLDQWHRSLGTTDAERNRRRREFWREFVESIVDAKGPPPGSFADTSTTPTTYWCSLPGGGMAQILVEPDRRVSLISSERRILVVDLNLSPGPLG